MIAPRITLFCEAHGATEVSNMSYTRLLSILLFLLVTVDCFNVVYFARRGKRGLKRTLEDDAAVQGNGNNSNNNPVNPKSSVNQGKGQEITGVTLPELGKLRGWEFGGGVRIACANVGGKYYAVQVNLPFDRAKAIQQHTCHRYTHASAKHTHHWHFRFFSFFNFVLTS